jgi:hypothetical protein
MTIESIMGKTLEIKIIDLIVPLSDGTAFDVENLAKETGASRKKIKKVLEANVARKFLLKFEAEGREVYRKNPNSHQAIAVNALLHSIYADQIRAESMKKMGIKEESK